MAKAAATSALAEMFQECFLVLRGRENALGFSSPSLTRRSADDVCRRQRG